MEALLYRQPYCSTLCHTQTHSSTEHDLLNSKIFNIVTVSNIHACFIQQWCFHDDFLPVYLDLLQCPQNGSYISALSAEEISSKTIQKPFWRNGCGALIQHSAIDGLMESPLVSSCPSHYCISYVHLKMTENGINPREQIENVVMFPISVPYRTSSLHLPSTNTRLGLNRNFL